MEQSQLIHATLSDPDGRSDRLIYLIQVDVARVQQTQGASDEAAALASAARTVQGVIAGAFPRCVLAWDAPETFNGEMPTYDPLYKMEEVKVWILPVVTKNEAYLYLVG